MPYSKDWPFLKAKDCRLADNCRLRTRVVAIQDRLGALAERGRSHPGYGHGCETAVDTFLVIIRVPGFNELGYSRGLQA